MMAERHMNYRGLSKMNLAIDSPPSLTDSLSSASVTGHCVVLPAFVCVNVRATSFQVRDPLQYCRPSGLFFFFFHRPFGNCFWQNMATEMLFSSFQTCRRWWCRSTSSVLLKSSGMYKLSIQMASSELSSKLPTKDSSTIVGQPLTNQHNLAPPAPRPPFISTESSPHPPLRAHMPVPEKCGAT